MRLVAQILLIVVAMTSAAIVGHSWVPMSWPRAITLSCILGALFIVQAVFVHIRRSRVSRD